MTEKSAISDPVEARAVRLDLPEGDEHVALVTLLGPGKGNAMGPDFFRELPRAFAHIDADERVRVAVIRGSGENFTYGLDLKAMLPELGPLLMGDNMARSRTKLLATIGELQRAFDAVERCRVPVIAAIDGWCIGGGVDLAAACDVRICSDRARFSVREVKVAMVADLGSLQRLPRIIGQGHTRELAYTGRDIDANRALAIGLVNDVHPGPLALSEAALALAREIGNNPPLVVEGIKAVLLDGDGQSVAQGLRHVALWNSAFLPSQDLGEAFGAFAERRPPKFTGK